MNRCERLAKQTTNFDTGMFVAVARDRCKHAIANTATGAWLNQALARIERLADLNTSLYRQLTQPPNSEGP